MSKCYDRPEVEREIYPGNTVVTTFVLDDFRGWLSDAEFEIIAANPWLIAKLRDMFLDGLGWTEAAEIAVTVLREENPITLKPRSEWTSCNG